MTSTRRYVSPVRDAKAAETKDRIVDAFLDQLVVEGRETLSPKDAAEHAGCSVRTVHSHFPTTESRIAALAERLEHDLYADSLTLPSDVDDLPEHYRRVHRVALDSPITAALLSNPSREWQEIRAARRADRLAAVRDTVESIGAPKRETEDALGVLLALAGGEVSLAMRDQLGVPEARIPDAIAHVVELITSDLREAST